MCYWWGISALYLGGSVVLTHETWRHHKTPTTSKYIYIHTLHYITLHCIALHYITLHYIHTYGKNGYARNFLGLHNLTFHWQIMFFKCNVENTTEGSIWGTFYMIPVIVVDHGIPHTKPLYRGLCIFGFTTLVIPILIPKNSWLYLVISPIKPSINHDRVWVCLK